MATLPLPMPQTTQIGYLTVLEAKSLKSLSLSLSQGIIRAAFLLEAVGENPCLSRV